ncbi:hypothetical protein RHGRI_001561 [Rhododendron griersonianum]|uniref:Uncharacterized protein n=1 Tax=Rhododendron griersonianum TaxID=479676 RepID=A0AAV6LL65_9ERIC|nr:hypothetical protein RHGRI_001561 [Rhododendron griersonianum]
MTERERERARWVWLAAGGCYGDDGARDGGMVVAVKRTEVAIENLTGLLGEESDEAACMPSNSDLHEWGQSNLMDTIPELAVVLPKLSQVDHCTL